MKKIKPIFLTLTFLLLAGSAIAQTSVEPGFVAPEKGLYFTAEQSATHRAYVERIELDLAKAEEDVRHYKTLWETEADTVTEMRENFDKQFLAWQDEKQGYQDEVNVWKLRWEDSNNYIDKLEKRNGGGFWNNRAVTFISDFLIFGGTVWAVSELRVN